MRSIYKCPICGYEEEVVEMLMGYVEEIKKDNGLY